MDVNQPAVRKRRSESVLGDGGKERQEDAQAEREIFARVSEARLARRMKASEHLVYRKQRQRVGYYCCSCDKETAWKNSICAGCGHDRCPVCQVHQS